MRKSRSQVARDLLMIRKIDCYRSPLLLAGSWVKYVDNNANTSQSG